MRVFKTELKNIYGFLGKENRNPTLTCYLPQNTIEMGKRPCIVICPGGGYGCCSAREGEPIAIKFLNWGFNAFVLNYSTAPNHYPTQLIEVASVFEEIYANADDWNCDIQKIGIIGFSAGGHLAAHYSNTYNCPEVRKLFPSSKKPSFTVLCYPVISADESFAHKDSFINLLGEYPKGNNIDKFSCEKLVTTNTPPTFIWHTAEDQCVPVKNSLCYATALANNNVPVSLHIYPYGPHGLSTCDLITNDQDRLTDKVRLAYSWLESLKNWIENLD